MVRGVGELLQEGLRLHRAGALKEAIEFYAQALAVDSGNLDARYYLCLIVSQQGRTEEALSRANELLAADFQQPRVHKLVGSLLARMGRCGFRRIADRIPTQAGQHSDDCGQAAESGLSSVPVDNRIT